MVQLSGETYKHDDSPQAALKTLARFLLRRSQSTNSVAKAFSRVQCINALQVVLDSANKRVLRPEESYVLKSDYRIQKQKSSTLSGNTQRL
jgi:hypothetical protein